MILTIDCAGTVFLRTIIRAMIIGMPWMVLMAFVSSMTMVHSSELYASRCYTKMPYLYDRSVVLVDLSMPVLDGT